MTAHEHDGHFQYPCCHINVEAILGLASTFLDASPSSTRTLPMLNINKLFCVNEIFLTDEKEPITGRVQTEMYFLLQT